MIYKELKEFIDNLTPEQLEQEAIVIDPFGDNGKPNIILVNTFAVICNSPLCDYCNELNVNNYTHIDIKPNHPYIGLRN